MVSRVFMAPAVAAMAAVTTAKNPFVSQANGTELQGTAGAFSLADFSVGLAVGSYGSLTSIAYDEDCFSTFFNFAFDSV